MEIASQSSKRKVWSSMPKQECPSMHKALQGLGSVLGIALLCSVGIICDSDFFCRVSKRNQANEYGIQGKVLD